MTMVSMEVLLSKQDGFSNFRCHHVFHT